MKLYCGFNEIVSNFGRLKVSTLSSKIKEKYLYTFEVEDREIFGVRKRIFDIHSRVDIILHLKKVQKLLGYEPEEFNPVLIESILSNETDFFSLGNRFNETILKAHNQALPNILRISEHEFVVVDANKLRLISQEVI